MVVFKTDAGRLREACVIRIHELRAAYDEQGNPLRPAKTYQEISAELGLSLGTVYSVCTGRTHRAMVPLGHPLHPATRTETLR